MVVRGGEQDFLPRAVKNSSKGASETHVAIVTAIPIATHGKRRGLVQKVRFPLSRTTEFVVRFS